MWGILKAHVVSVVAFVGAGVSFLFSPANAWYEAIDWRTLNLLFCLMVVVAGLRECALFRTLATKLLHGRKRLRPLAHLLVQFTFILSMFATNDVALLALTPFTIYLLDKLNLRERIPKLIVLQTIAANLGSMATPIGNPQNLFLYTTFKIPTLDFFCAMLPLTVLGMLLLFLFTHFLKDVPLPQHEERPLPPLPRQMYAYGALFILCLCAVFRLIHNAIPFVFVTGYALFGGRTALKKVDYGLLVTFLCFFVFSGNLAQIPWISEMLSSFLAKHTQATAVLASQGISNVPAAILLAPFTDDWKALLFGVDIGGFGTPIASLASLISLGIYLKEPDAAVGRYLLLFISVSLVFLIVLSFCSLFL